MAAVEGRGCLCTDDKGYLISQVSRVDAVCSEFELPTARDVEWLLFSYT